jgi:hypothetical protein
MFPAASLSQIRNSPGESECAHNPSRWPWIVARLEEFLALSRRGDPVTTMRTVHHVIRRRLIAPEHQAVKMAWQRTITPIQSGTAMRKPAIDPYVADTASSDSVLALYDPQTCHHLLPAPARRGRRAPRRTIFINYGTLNECMPTFTATPVSASFVRDLRCSAVRFGHRRFVGGSYC